MAISITCLQWPHSVSIEQVFQKCISRFSAAVKVLSDLPQNWHESTSSFLLDLVFFYAETGLPDEPPVPPFGFIFVEIVSFYGGDYFLAFAAAGSTPSISPKPASSASI